MKNTVVASIFIVLSLFGSTMGPAHSADKLVEIRDQLRHYVDARRAV